MTHFEHFERVRWRRGQRLTKRAFRVGEWVSGVTIVSDLNPFGFAANAWGSEGSEAGHRARAEDPRNWLDI